MKINEKQKQVIEKYINFNIEVKIDLTVKDNVFSWDCMIHDCDNRSIYSIYDNVSTSVIDSDSLIHSTCEKHLDELGDIKLNRLKGVTIK